MEHMDLLIHPNARAEPECDKQLDYILEFWDMVNRQDIEIVETVQQGISTRAYPGGRMCYEFEEPVHRFQNMVIDRMLGIDRIPDGDDATEIRPGID